MKDKILIAGGSGYVGTHLTQLLETNGYEVSWLSRNESKRERGRVITWDYKTPHTEVDQALMKHPVIINLCGASLGGKRWTRKYKNILVKSRIESSQALVHRILQLSIRPTLFIQASAIGYYGTGPTEKAYIELDKKGEGFLAELCDHWEKTVAPLQHQSIPVSILRIAPVFNPGSDVFEKWAKPFRHGMGAVVGTGTQYFPFIDIENLCRIVQWVIEENKQGIYNAVYDGNKQHKEIASMVAHYVGHPIRLPRLPGELAKLIFGEAAVLITEGAPVSGSKLIGEGFQFDEPSFLKK